MSWTSKLSFLPNVVFRFGLLDWLVETLDEEQEEIVGVGLSSLREEDAVLVDTFAKVNLVYRLLSAEGFGANVMLSLT